MQPVRGHVLAPPAKQVADKLIDTGVDAPLTGLGTAQLGACGGYPQIELTTQDGAFAPISVGIYFGGARTFRHVLI